MTNLVVRPPRHFLPEDFSVTTWGTLQPYFETLEQTDLNSVETLEAWLKQRSELEAVLEEDFAWRYIDMNCDTSAPEKQERFVYFVEHIQPKLAVWSDRLNKKIAQSIPFESLPDDPYLTFKRSTKRAVEIFRSENVPLYTELEKTAQKFGEISGAMTITHDGEELTMPAAAQLLESPDRVLREAVYRKMVIRRAQDVEALDGVLDTLITKRHQVALNAGFKNFRDYQFSALGRFDYSAQDCKTWHEAVALHVVPLLREIHQKRAENLRLDCLRPWDLAVDPSGLSPLKPFTDGADLLVKTKRAFARLNPSFAEYLEIMDQLGHFDLESRKGKAPGGFNYPLYEIGVPFIYMNAVGTQRDLETMVHEGGHAIHSFLSRDWPLNEFKSTPSEVAELASMSMELLSMAVWDEFYPDSASLARAQHQKIEDAISTLPWVALVDAFQHWLYEHPDHSRLERNTAWRELFARFDTGVVHYEGFESALDTLWQKQMHIFEVPFYYIEYGFAQVGAISLWQNFMKDREKALSGYQNFMRLGYSKTIPELFEAAGITFDTSPDQIKNLTDFMRLQLNSF